MTNRRFEMYEYRNIIVRMRLGESDRALAKSGLVGRKKAKKIRGIAAAQGWLESQEALPEDTVLAEVLEESRAPIQSTSLVLPHSEDVTDWWKQGIGGTTIHQTLIRKYGFGGSYSSVRRYLASLEQANPQTTTVLEFCAGRGGAG